MSVVGDSCILPFYFYGLVGSFLFFNASLFLDRDAIFFVYFLENLPDFCFYFLFLANIQWSGKKL